MNRFITALIPIVLTACATTHQVSLPQDGFSIEGVDVGDRVNIVMNDGQKRKMSVTRIDELGLHDNNDFCFYVDMQSVAVIEKRQTKGVWWLLLSLAAVAILAEPDDGGSGPLCLRSSEGGPCLP